ncbi:hypothetical protein L7F22_036297 [Adiantum nelumboides]|nr:hypothetical protein [Adiantum nelumboides]
MNREGISPDTITFIWVLIGCTHAGKAELAQMYLKSMVEVYGINPSIQHYTCVADLFCRIGLIQKALTFINELPLDPDPVVWYILLDASQKLGNVEACRKAFERTVRLDAKDASAYLRLCNIYAGSELREDASSSHPGGEGEHMCFQGFADEGEDVLVSNWG